MSANLKRNKDNNVVKRFGFIIVRKNKVSTMVPGQAFFSNQGGKVWFACVGTNLLNLHLFILI
jgi:hypothetical protein